MATLDFEQPMEKTAAPDSAARPISTGTAALFGEEPELPPTWSEDSEVFHMIERCSRLQAIRKNRRITGKPGVRVRLCFNCEDIIRTKRSG